MSISERFSNACKLIASKMLWVVLIPIALDLANLFSWEKAFHAVYNPVQKIFLIKLGFIGAPPSVSYLLEDFPSPLFKYDNNGLSGIVNRFSLFNILLVITVLLITSFLHSGYLSIIGTDAEEEVRVRDFFIKGNKRWYKFFLLNCITWFPLFLTIFDKSLIYLSFISIIFVYVKYSFVTEDVSISENFKLGISFLFNNLGLSIKMGLYFGIIFSLLSVIVFPLGRVGTFGIIIDIIICAYFGAATNRAVLEVYSTEENDLITPYFEGSYGREIWDAYKEDGTLAGCDLIRGEQIPDGLHHAVAEIFVLHTDGTVLITQRDFNKPNYPGLYESGAGGSVLKGETFLEGAIRELKEETGIYCKDLKEIYTVTTHDTIYKGYMCVVDIDKESITLQPGETIAYQWMNKSEFLDLCNSELFVPNLRNRLNEFIESNIVG